MQEARQASDRVTAWSFPTRLSVATAVCAVLCQFGMPDGDLSMHPACGGRGSGQPSEAVITTATWLQTD